MAQVSEAESKSKRSLILSMIAIVFGLIAVSSIILMFASGYYPLRDALCSSEYCFELVDARLLTLVAALSGIFSIALTTRAQVAGAAIGILIVLLGVIGAIAVWPEIRVHTSTTQYSPDDALLRKMRGIVSIADTIPQEELLSYEGKLSLTDGIGAKKFTLSERRRIRIDLKIPDAERRSAELQSDPFLELYFEDRSSGSLRRTLIAYDDDSGEDQNNSQITRMLAPSTCDNNRCTSNYLIVARNAQADNTIGVLANTKVFDLLVKELNWLNLFESNRRILLNDNNSTWAIRVEEDEEDNERDFIVQANASQPSCLVIEVDPDNDRDSGLILMSENGAWLRTDDNSGPGVAGSRVEMPIEANSESIMFADVIRFGGDFPYELTANLEQGECSR